MKLGEYQDLYYIKKVDFGVYLAEEPTSETHVLLPAKQVPEDARQGEKVHVFLYKDSKDRLIDARCLRAAYRQGSRQDRCISGLGTGEGSVPSV